MKAKSIISILILVVFAVIGAKAQAPQGMSYQSVVRNSAGATQISTPGTIRFSILVDGESGTPVYVETQTFTTSAQGLIVATIGKGSPTQGTFSAINWSVGNYYLKVEVDISNKGSYSLSGTSPIVSVPYALYSGTAGNLAATGGSSSNVLTWDGGNTDPNVALFEVKDKNGNPIFSVYPTGVEIIFDETAPVRGAKGGFAVSGRNSTRAVVDIMRMNADSTTVYVNNLAKRGAKGGFAVSGRNSTRAGASEILRVTPDSTRIYTSNAASGFGVGQRGSGTTDSYLKLLPNNYFIGHQSGIKTTGLYNTFFGYTTGLANTTGANNIFIGYEVGKTNTTGSFNTFLGYQAGFTNNASYNSFVGYQAGKANTSGQFNTFFGYNAGLSNNTGVSNVFIGNESGKTNTGGSSNVFIGKSSGAGNTTGSSNLFIGKESGFKTTTGFSNLFLGENSGYSNLTGEHNVFIGQFAGYSGTALKNNIFIGDSSGYNSNNQFATNNVFIGYAAGKNTQSYNNIFLGNQAGWSNSGGQNNIAIGDKAGYSNTTSQNIFIGTEAGKSNTTGSFNIMMGRYTGRNVTTGSQQILIGGGAGGSLTTGNENIMLGSNAGAINDGDRNIFIGNSAGWSNTGSNNIIMGYKVGYAYFQTVSNRLIIDNSQVAAPLIWGEFDNRRLVINGTNTNNSTNRNFFVNGSAGGTGGWFNDSDMRLKKSIKTIQNPLEKVMALHGVNFEWKDTSNHEKGIQIGFIAQEAEKIIPEVVNYSKENDVYSMQYAPITALLVEAMKEQQLIINNQAKENTEQKASIDELKARIAKLEELVNKLATNK
ncbi:tail fiber domain-containing protein [Williamwhitmania taraxaci]|uniref:Chaperone of endosialidase n=1 Tax=Williamwhitmania taraxaci TaxID=1640674 RepID=A0A1G6RFE5_9BACT|nr:tail fiber domain-containing protein [Williamwhitmania taraxaci]SDD03372.1 Chaperone of endosialidase [Williamwhitmania taraxaci]